MNATDTPGRRLGVNQFVDQSLMIPFAMELDDKLRDSLVENGARRTGSTDRDILV
jgi:hypothetical protein